MAVGGFFFGFLIAGLPIAFVLALTAFVYIMISGNTVLLLSYRELAWRDFFPAFKNAARSSAVVLFLIAAAQVFSWVITFENLPAIVATWMQSVTDSPILFLLMLNLLLLMLGMITDPIPVIILVVPVLLSVATNVYGIDPFQFGVIVCLNLTLGLLTPPVGTGLFTAALSPSHQTTMRSVFEDFSGYRN